MPRHPTRQSLAENLSNLGIESEDLLFIHSSFKSLGPVDGGADTVIGALEDVVGARGLILMPSFNLIDKELRTKVWDVETTPSTVGWLTEYFRKMAGTYRSDHPSHSVAVRGKGASEFVTGHLLSKGFKSPWDRNGWGRTYGTHSPMFKAYEENGKLLMLGVDYESSTYVHFVEVVIWNARLARNSAAEYPKLDRPALGAFWDQAGNLMRGLLGDADCRLFNIRDYVDALLHEVQGNPHPYLLKRKQ